MHDVYEHHRLFLTSCFLSPLVYAVNEVIIGQRPRVKDRWVGCYGKWIAE